MGKKAVYLRKSRDESGGKEDVLAKHRMTLVELCEKNGWEYEIYPEIGSSDSLEARPKMMQLLEDVDDGLYDGVVVMEYERLSRGDEMDSAIIKRTFQKAKVKVITPVQVYDPDDETSEALMGVAAIFGRMEYRKIKRRLKAGKLSGAKQGKWVQGNPPLPYVYNAEKKRLDVDEAKRPHYVLMKQMYLDGYTPTDIAYRVNAMGIKTNRGGKWVAETVQRLLLNPVHMGKIVYGKTKREGNSRRVTQLNPDQWITSEGGHERLKTPEEHARIVALVASRRRLANRSKEGTTPLSGLVKCARCGKTVRSIVRRGKYLLYACATRGPVGEKCGNGGARAEWVYEHISDWAEKELQAIHDEIGGRPSRSRDSSAVLDNLRRDIASQEAKLARFVDLVGDGLLSKENFAQRKEVVDATIGRLRQEVASLEASRAKGSMPVDERVMRLRTLTDKTFWFSDQWTDKERHAYLSLVIDRVTLYIDSPGKTGWLKITWRE